MPRLPTLFISHGAGPAFFIEATGSPLAELDQNSKFAGLFKAVGTAPDKFNLPTTPSAIVVVSAHWEEPTFTVLGHPSPGLLFDYYGFPSSSYQLKYGGTGDTKLAQRITTMLTNNLPPEAPKPKLIGTDSSKPSPRGFDHGVFLPLMLLYPKFTGPVIQISLEHSLNPAFHYFLGRALAPLRDENILILASGQSTHPMRTLQGSAGLTSSTRQNIQEFMRRLQSVITNSEDKDDQSRLARITKTLYSEEADKYLHAAHNPNDEHLIPIWVAMGASDPGEMARELFPGQNMNAMNGLMNMQCFVWGGGGDHNSADNEAQSSKGDL